MVKFAANQLLVVSNLKEYFSSFSTILDEVIIISHCHQFFFIVVEVHLQDHAFNIVDYNFDFGDLLCWVEGVTAVEIKFGS